MKVNDNAAAAAIVAAISIFTAFAIYGEYEAAHLERVRDEGTRAHLSSIAPQSVMEAADDIIAVKNLRAQEEADRKAALLAEYRRRTAPITLDQFYDIEIGMTYEQVKETLGGRDGVIQSKSVMPGIATVLVGWNNPGAFSGNMSVMFQTDGEYRMLVTTKSQFGLK